MKPGIKMYIRIREKFFSVNKAYGLGKDKL